MFIKLMVVRYFNGLGLMERFVMNIMNNNFILCDVKKIY